MNNEWHLYDMNLYRDSFQNYKVYLDPCGVGTTTLNPLHTASHGSPSMPRTNEGQKPQGNSIVFCGKPLSY